MYKDKIKQLKEIENNLLNKIKTETNVLNYYKNMYTQENKSHLEYVKLAKRKINRLRLKLFIGNLFVLGTIFVGSGLIATISTSTALLVPTIVMALSSTLLNYNAKSNKLSKDKLITSLDTFLKKEQECAKAFEEAQKNIESWEKTKNEISNKINELSNAQEFYERTSKKYGFKTNFSKNDKIIEK